MAGDANVITHCSGLPSRCMKTGRARSGFKNVEFKTYQGMPHSTCPEELADIRAYLARILPDKVPTR